LFSEEVASLAKMNVGVDEDDDDDMMRMSSMGELSTYTEASEGTEMNVKVVLDHVGPPTPPPASPPRVVKPEAIVAAVNNDGQKTFNSSNRSVSFKEDDDDEDNTIPDVDKTHGQLIEKIQSLLAKLKSAQVEASTQKSLRRQKDKNLAKLAKELTKRKDQRNKDVETIEHVSTTHAQYPQVLFFCGTLILSLSYLISISVGRKDQRIGTPDKSGPQRIGPSQRYGCQATQASAKGI
jgi:hypothetical protein